MKSSFISKTTFKIGIILLIAQLSLSARLHAQSFTFPTRDENVLHTASQIKSHGLFDTITVYQDKWDEMISNSNWQQNLKFKSVHDYVRFFVDHSYPFKIDSAYTLRLTYQLRGYGNPNDTNSYTTINDTLTISYNPDSLSMYQDMQYKQYSNFHKITIILTGLYKLYGSGSSFTMQPVTLSNFTWLNFNVEGAIAVQPYYKRVKNPGGSYVNVYGATAPPLDIKHYAVDGNNLLKIEWTIQGGAFGGSPPELIPAKYELEWTYVDNYKVAANGTVSTKPANQLQYDFRNNATRVVLDDNRYYLPVIYQQGYIIYRIRTIRPDSSQYRYPIYGQWTIPSDKGLVSSVNASSFIALTTAYLHDSLNWQYTVSFAEQGKYKHVLSFYDGLLKNRQSITRFNSQSHNTIATEQVYDYEGRPSISILPTPVMASNFTYQRKLSLNAATGLPYKAADFDGVQFYACPTETTISPLHPTALARLYYSTANTDQGGFQKFVPDAGGYPFVQTIYSPGYDNRIDKQGGAGDSLQIGFGHYTKNDYVNADQADLDRLFGLNIGRAGFYRKTVTRDPNGQVSLNITDYHGKAVASSLIGVPDTSSLAIVRNTNVPDSSMMAEDLIAGTTQQIIGTQRILDKMFYMDVDGNSLHRYEYDFTPYQVPFCTSKYLSVAAAYDYRIADQCGDTVAHKADTLGVTGVVTSGQTIASSSAPASTYLEQGPYSLNKTLTFNPDAISAAVDSFMSLPDNCLKTEEWFVKQEVLSKEFPCSDNPNDPCAAAKAKMMMELWPNLDSANAFRKYGYYTGSGESLSSNNNSIFSGIVGKSILRYQDTCLVHLPDTVIKNGIVYTHLQDLPVDTFIAIFNDDIAEALLPLHPEYCALLNCNSDAFYDRLQHVPDFATAQALGLSTLDDIIHSDPLYAQLNIPPASFPNAVDSLSHTSSGMSIDSMAILQAYCNCNDMTMYDECRQHIFNVPIQQLLLDNSFLRERYIKALVPLYLANRQRFIHFLSEAAATGDCATCQDVRMTLVPPSVFTDWNEPIGNNGTVSTDPNSFLGQAATYDSAAAAQFGGLINQINSVSPDDTTGIAVLQDSAAAIYAQGNNALCEGAVDYIMQDLVNCADSANLVGVRNYLLNLCATGQVLNGNYTPDQIITALISNNIEINDLCNPYLVSYDHFPTATATDGSGIACKNVLYYYDLTAFLNNKALNALTHLNTVQSATLSTGNQFENAIYSVLGTTSVKVVASYLSNESTYLLKVYKLSGDTVHIYFKGEVLPNGGNSQPFNVSGGTTLLFSETDCINGAAPGFAQGYIGLNAFVPVLATINGSNAVYYNLLAWTDKVQVNQPATNPLADCVPCTQMRSLYTQFMGVMNMFSVLGTDHPFYSKMLRNYMNYTLKSSYTDLQYERFIESCALSDSMEIPKYGAYATLEFVSKGASDTFLNLMREIDTTVFISPLLRYMTPNDNVEVLLDFNTLPASKLRQYRDFVRNYTPVMSKYIGDPSFDYVGNVGLLLIQGQITADQVFGYSDNNFVISYYSNNVYSKINDDGTIIPGCTLYAINKYDLPPFKLAGKMDTLVRYFINHPELQAVFIPVRDYMVDSDYYKRDKKIYLLYTYHNQQLPPYQVVDSVQAPRLMSTIYADRTAEYGTTAEPGEIQNLYITNSDPQQGTQFAKLSQIIGLVGNYFSGGLFFNDASSHTIVNSGSDQLIAYQCSTGDYWYRFFTTGDSLFDVFIKIPAYMDPGELPLYKINGFRPANGDTTSRAFTIDIYIPGQPGSDLTLNGYTDFPVAHNGKLSDVLLTHPLNQGTVITDTVDNCERERLNAAIVAGKIKYQQYIDSIHQYLVSHFTDYILNQGVHEYLYLSYMGQRFNYTLYNYDRAGNLIQTVPPAGVVMLDTTLQNQVETARQNNTFSSSLVPVDHKASNYYYNSINQVTNQQTPDGGKTYFFYDAAGRVVFSQNDKQKPGALYSYTLYDAQGRINQTGEVKIGCGYFAPYYGSPAGVDSVCSFYDPTTGMITSVPPIVTDLKSYTNDDIRNYVIAKQRNEVVLTTYDTQAFNLGQYTGMSSQENLRKRVATIEYFDAMGGGVKASTQYTYAMHFSYDVSGNVKTLTRDYPKLEPFGHRFKRVDYDYDQISGKVNMLSYNRSFADQFYQKYTYDDDNRITKAETSNDGIIWKQDATYEYYQHGPLARISIGDLKVQGIDYAYTIQGWLKSINGDLLKPDKDMGADGTANSVYSNDAEAITLDYFKGDYKPIGTTQVTNLEQTAKSMYNGNIPRMSTSILPFPDLETHYRYDQLNRIVKADYDLVSRDSGTLTATPMYASSYAYDPDGNITKLVRRGNLAAQVMDTLVYHYTSGNYNNKLNNITDYAADAFDNDIRHFTNTSVARYLYDATGNVIKDLVSGIDTIKWNHYDKVGAVTKVDSATSMYFAHDGAGNRYLKTLSRTEGDSTLDNSEYYVRDAQGNMLAVYKLQSNYVKKKVWVPYVFHWLFTIAGASQQQVLGYVIKPYYAFDGNFEAAVLDSMLHDGSWSTGQINSHPHAFYFDNDVAVKMNTLHYGKADYNAFFTGLSNYAAAKDTQVLAGALLQFVNSNTNLLNPVLELPLSIGDSAVTDAVLGHFCNANQILYAAFGLDATEPPYKKVGTMRDFIAENGISTFVQAIKNAYIHTNAGNELFGFLEGVSNDDTLLQNPVLFDPRNNPLSLIYADALTQFGADSLLGDFFDGWDIHREWLYGANNKSDLLAVPYHLAPDSLLLTFINDHGDNEATIVQKGLYALPDLSFDHFYWTIKKGIPMIAGSFKIQDVIEKENIALASHVMYGSSRLGTKDYLPGQYYASWDYTQQQPVTDSAHLNTRVPWYSDEYNDDIAYTGTQPWGATQNTPMYAQHQIGQKQYELTNHLGNVQATVSDNRVAVGGGVKDSILGYRPALPTAYDYYPFGMLMPGRYISDTSQHCMTISTTKWVTTTNPLVIIYCLPCIQWLLNGQLTSTPWSGTDTLTLPIDPVDTTYGTVYTPVSVTPGVLNELHLSVDYISAGSAGIRLAAFEESAGTYKELGSTIIAGSRGDYKLLFTPTGAEVHLTLVNMSTTQLAFLHLGEAHLLTTTTTTPITVYETVCNEDKDKYRFGFNGQEKVNEWAGIGNNLAFENRGYDSRIARFLSVDPLIKSYPWYSSYQFAGNTPIQAIDLEGNEPIKSGTVAQVTVYNGGTACTISSEVTIKVQVVNLSSTPNSKLNLSMIRGYINQFGQQIAGTHTSTITSAFKLDSKGNLMYLGTNSTIKATYNTKVTTQVEFINSVDKITNDAVVLGIVNQVRGAEDALAVGSDQYAVGLIPASSLSNENIASLGAKLISHELGHIFGLGHAPSGSMKTQDKQNQRGFTEDEETEMNRTLLGNWNDLWKKIKKNKSKPADLQFQTNMRDNFQFIYNHHGG